MRSCSPPQPCPRSRRRFVHHRALIVPHGQHRGGGHRGCVCVLPRGGLPGGDVQREHAFRNGGLDQHGQDPRARVLGRVGHLQVHDKERVLWESFGSVKMTGSLYGTLCMAPTSHNTLSPSASCEACFSASTVPVAAAIFQRAPNAKLGKHGGDAADRRAGARSKYLILIGG